MSAHLLVQARPWLQASDQHRQQLGLMDKPKQRCLKVHPSFLSVGRIVDRSGLL